MDELKKVGVLENEIEAQLLESILKERDIPYVIKSYHDAAYDGIFVPQKGWGAVYAPEPWAQEIKEVLVDLRESNAE